MKIRLSTSTHACQAHQGGQQKLKLCCGHWVDLVRLWPAHNLLASDMLGNGLLLSAQTLACSSHHARHLPLSHLNSQEHTSHTTRASPATSSACGRQDPTPASKPSLAHLALDCTSLLTHWLAPLPDTLEPLLVTGRPCHTPHTPPHKQPALMRLKLVLGAVSSRPHLHMLLQPACDLVASSYYSALSSSNPTSFFTTSRHLFVGPHLGRG